MEIIGYISALFIGLSLGLIGSGGTILALPIFVYLFGIKDMMAATHYSMFVVGVTAFVGAVRKHKEGYVDIRTAVYFLIPSLISLFFTRKIVLPAIPAVIITIGDVVITKNLFLLLLFSIVMLISSISMIRNAKKE
ncbi:MAG TPA: sulfite exporter TauE/SafE family protein, partial [Chitinophagales bacterium]|nr:sulfite exporter TauE/SafE family protein [Chitinophagales bacterium]